MANALTKPTFRHPTAVLGPVTDTDLVKVRVRVKRASTAASAYEPNSAAAPLWPLDDVPWLQNVDGQSGSLRIITQEDLDSAQADVEAAEAALAAALAALTAAKDDLATAQTALANGQATAAEAEDAWDATRMERWKALINLQTAQDSADPARIADAQARMDSAEQAKQEAADALIAARAPLDGLVNDAANRKTVRGQAGEAAVTARQWLDHCRLALTLTQANAEACPDPDDPDPAPYSEYLGGGAGNLAGAVAGNEWIGPFLGTDGYGCLVNAIYFRSWFGGVCQVEVVMSDAFYQGAKDQGFRLKLDVGGVWRAYPKISVTDTPPTAPEGEHQCMPFSFYDGQGELTVSYEDFGISLAVDDAEQDEDTGEWIVRADPVTADAPDPGSETEPADQSRYSIVGPPVLPSTSVANVQYRGAERYRQGWAEFTTANGSQARRYLTLTASEGEGTPTDKHYSGSLALVAPDDPNPANARPLVLQSTLSDDIGNDVGDNPPAPGPDALTVVTDGATVISPTVRRIDNPKGLVLTLIDEQTTADILGEVNAIASQAWPEPTEDDPDPDAPPSLVFQGAKRYLAPSGDYCCAQQMRFKLNYNASDERIVAGSTCTTTHTWRYRRRDLDTGAVTYETDGKTKTLTWPREGFGNVFAQDDAEWTEISAPSANESVELELLAAENTDPHNFGTYVVSLIPGG